MTIVLTTVSTPVVLTAPGPQGPKGDTGEVISTQSYQAGENLSGHRVVRIVGGYAYACRGNVQADAGLAIGITTGAALEGDTVQVQTIGRLTEPSWNLIGGPVYVGALGQLTQYPAAMAFTQQIGIAVSPTSLDINPQIAIVH